MKMIEEAGGCENFFCDKCPNRENTFCHKGAGYLVPENKGIIENCSEPWKDAGSWQDDRCPWSATEQYWNRKHRPPYSA